MEQIHSLQPSLSCAFCSQVAAPERCFRRGKQERKSTCTKVQSGKEWKENEVIYSPLGQNESNKNMYV